MLNDNFTLDYCVKTFYSPEWDKWLNPETRDTAYQYFCDISKSPVTRVYSRKILENVRGISGKCPNVPSGGRCYCGRVPLDITAFKAYNDRLGYSVGDGILRAFAKKIENLITQINLQNKWTKLCLFHPGGDEFEIICFQAIQCPDETGRCTRTSNADLLGLQQRLKKDLEQLKEEISKTVFLVCRPVRRPGGGAEASVCELSEWSEEKRNSVAKDYFVYAIRGLKFHEKILITAQDQIAQEEQNIETGDDLFVERGVFNRKTEIYCSEINLTDAYSLPPEQRQTLFDSSKWISLFDCHVCLDESGSVKNDTEFHYQLEQLITLAPSTIISWCQDGVDALALPIRYDAFNDMALEQLGQFPEIKKCVHFMTWLGYSKYIWSKMEEIQGYSSRMQRLLSE